MLGLIRTETAIGAGAGEYHAWISACQGRDVELRLRKSALAGGPAVLRTRFPISGPRSVDSAIWVMEAGHEWEPILLGRLRMLVGAGSAASKLCFEGRARARKAQLTKSAQAVRRDGELLARELIARIAFEVENMRQADAMPLSA